MRTFQSRSEALAFIQTLPWGTAAGTSRDPKQILKYAQAGAKIVTHGSNTMAPRKGNEGNNFHYDSKSGRSLNSLGIPNQSLSAYLDTLTELKKAVNACGSELWVSISAGDSFSNYEYHAMTSALIHNSAADVVAGNTSCPNIVVNGNPKPAVCYDPDSFELAVSAMRSAAGSNRIAVKIAPITEANLLKKIVNIALAFDVDYLEVANTIGNCYFENEEGKPAIAMGRGGLAGSALIPLVTGMIQIIKPVIEGSKMKLIAIGGVHDGLSAYNYLRHGADGFQFATELYRRDGDPDVIQEIIVGDADVGKVGLLDYLVKYGL